MMFEFLFLNGKSPEGQDMLKHNNLSGALCKLPGNVPGPSGWKLFCVDKHKSSGSKQQMIQALKNREHSANLRAKGILFMMKN